MKWPVHRLDHLCMISTGKTPPRSHGEYFGGEHVWVTIADLNDGLVSSSKERVTDKAIVDANMRLVTPGTVLLSYKLTLGKLGIAGCPLYTNEAIAALTPRSGVTVMPKFVYYAMKRVDFDALCHGAVKGKCLNRDSLSNIQLPLPPLSEQRRIVEILDQADALRKKRAQADAKAERILPALFHEMFGDPVRNEKEWPLKRFDEVCESRLGKMLDAKQQTGEHKRPYLRNANVQWNRLNLGEVHEMDFGEADRQEFRLQKGDLLICEGGEVGRCAIWNDELPECYFQKAIHRARPRPGEAVPEYLVHLLWQLARSGGLSDSTSQLTIAHLTGVKLKQMRIPLPPLALQKSFARVVQSRRSISDGQTDVTKHLDTLNATLLHRAFKGEL